MIMMIRLRQIKVPINSTKEHLISKCADKLKIKKDDILDIKISKQSLDSRKKPDLYFVYEIDVEVKNENYLLMINKDNDILKTPIEEYNFEITGTSKLVHRPIIVGSGPAGLFCAYILAENGYKPLIIERGKDVDNRVKDVDLFWKKGILNKESNVQFGEGGAGTFSDGKLNTMVKDPLHRGKKVFEIFVMAGAPEEIMYLNKPHIGTDLLRDVVKNIRNSIIKLGGEFRYNTKLTDIRFDNKLKSIIVNDNEEIECDVLVLAIGHSARDTFEMLSNKLIMEPKPFALGVRISHPQKMINKNQYGVEESNLGSASYKLTHTCHNGRGVYTFCMCPGGYVVNSSSEENRLSINGMSNHNRDSENANSAVIVTVTPSDFGFNPLDGIEYQRKLEEITYKVGNGKIPVQLYKDFKNNVKTTSLGDVNPVFKGEYILSNLNEIFPSYIKESLIEGIDTFNNKIKGFNRDDAIIAAIESRTSSPVRLVRNQDLESNIKGIYPCGEGAGYAGGITSAAMDGIKIAEAIAKQYKI